METLEKLDIQGLVARGYGNLAAAQFWLLAVDPAKVDQARAYLAELKVTDAETKPETTAVHIAFTAPGLRALGFAPRIVDTFAREFTEGMDHDVRSFALGDQGANESTKWAWGRRGAEPHAVLMVYATDEGTLTTELTRQHKDMAGGFTVLGVKQTTQLTGQREHFGFRDGISTPIMEGITGKPPESWTFPFRAGEFVLGYKNEYEAYSESPEVSLADDAADLLPRTPDGSAKDLGKNGTYLVFRELTQDVHAFWSYLVEHSREPGTDPIDRAVALGAKMVGRWPSGSPLALAPAGNDPALADENDFTYHDIDKLGHACPLGAHIRRTNPRDQIHSGRDQSDSLEMIRKHQMLRRGRAFGRPLAESLNPRDLAAAVPDLEARGLHFVCLVSHIARQFEFVQRAWVNSANFATLYKDGDPIIGTRRTAADPNPSDEFTVPCEPLRRKYKQMPQFTRVVGGAYFFLPGIAALRFLARGPAA